MYAPAKLDDMRTWFDGGGTDRRWCMTESSVGGYMQEHHRVVLCDHAQIGESACGMVTKERLRCK
jgi:hypothetical protein